MKSIVLCADDFALHAQVSQGIAALARQARLSATSVMSLSPRWPQDAALLADVRGRIDVGLHLDWTSAFARDAGHGLLLPALMARTLMPGWAHSYAATARVVIERQLDAFEAQWKAPPDHVDGHQHVQQFAGLRQPLIDILARRYARTLPYVRISRAPGWGKAALIRAMGARALERLAHQAGLAHNRTLLGSYNFGAQPARYAALMDQCLRLGPPGTLLMCHPAQSPADMPGDAIAAARVCEGAYLRSDAFAQALERAQARLVRGRELYKQGEPGGTL